MRRGKGKRGFQKGLRAASCSAEETQHAGEKDWEGEWNGTLRTWGDMGGKTLWGGGGAWGRLKGGRGPYTLILISPGNEENHGAKGGLEGMAVKSTDQELQKIFRGLGKFISSHVGGGDKETEKNGRKKGFGRRSQLI